jgi:2-C-methyl-D-erythritol 4-phosphate cytidylyltransferase
MSKQAKVPTGGDSPEMKKYAIIVAGGAGVRMGTTVPKQFLEVHGRPVLWYTLRTFLSAYADLEIVLVVPEEHLETAGELIKGLAGVERIRLASGGDTRFHSVRNGLEKIKVREGTGEERKNRLSFLYTTGFGAWSARN